ncbi:hypothetical protein GCM10010264_18320 [Streptomyces globisporus]|nr:hypothetical protein GCM10010264_18320 [Streptomyces globisporus]
MNTELKVFRFRRLLGAAVAVATVATTGAFTAPQTPAAASQTVTFDQPGEQAWTVPAGVERITVSVWGAGSGGSGGTGNTEALRIILYQVFDHLPAPPVLNGFPALWATGRAFAGPVIGAITVASLPEAFRRRAGLPEIAGVESLMQGAYLAAGLTRFLPEGWIRAENITELLSLSPDSDDPRARTVAALRDQMKRAGTLIRLITPLPPEHEPAAADSSAQRSTHEYFADVLDQTGDGYVTWADLAAMARELSGRLDLDEPEETRLYNAYANWWRELQAALDTDGDGRVSAAEYAAAVPSLAGPALIRVAEVLFDATDKDGDQTIDADEYRPCSAPRSTATPPAPGRRTAAARSSTTSCPSCPDVSAPPRTTLC